MDTGVDKAKVITDGQDDYARWVEALATPGADTDAVRRRIDRILADEVVLLNYDNTKAAFGRKQVLAALEDLARKTESVNFLRPVRAVDHVLVGLDHTVWKPDSGMDPLDHDCGDAFKVDDRGLVTEIRVCIIKNVQPPAAEAS
jgi:hypothetical protein